MYKVSVIIPTHNRKQLLEKAVASFFSQDYAEKELVIVDDGMYLDCNYGNGKSLICIHQKHKGCPAALNAGIKASTGDLICVLGDDDMLYGTSSLRDRANMFRGDTEVIYTSAQEIDDAERNMKVLHAEYPDKNKIWLQDYINIHTMMWKKNVHEKIGMFEEDMISNEDWEFKIKCLMECNIDYKDIITVYYRRHAKMKSMINHANGIMGRCKQIFIQRLKERYANNEHCITL